MSVLGTGVASGVAQTSFQAQQVARKQESEQADRQVRRVRQTLGPHLRAHDESDEVEDSMQLRIGDEPDHQPTHDRSSEPGDESAGGPQDAGTQNLSPDQTDQRLYRHLDVRG